jgi:hypothetical protein
MVAQKGVFTVHGSDLEFFESHADDCLRKIVLKSSAKGGAKEFLDYANLNSFTLYPDIVGMARYITRRYFGD